MPLDPNLDTKMFLRGLGSPHDLLKYRLKTQMIIPQIFIKPLSVARGFLFFIPFSFFDNISEKGGYQSFCSRNWDMVRF